MYNVSQNNCGPVLWYSGGAVDSAISGCIGQTSTYSFRTCSSQCSASLLIYGREKSK